MFNFKSLNGDLRQKLSMMWFCLVDGSCKRWTRSSLIFLSCSGMRNGRVGVGIGRRVTVKFISSGFIPNRPWISRLRERWKQTRIEWTPIPLSVGIAYIALAHYRNLRKRSNELNRSDEEALDASVDNDICICGFWQFYILKLLPLKTLSRIWGKCSEIVLPVCLRTPIYKLYAWIFGCNLYEMAEQDLKKIKNFSEFFYRELKPGVREIDSDALIVSPADGKVLHFGLVEGRRIEQVKGLSYSLDALIGNFLPTPYEGVAFDEDFSKILKQEKLEHITLLGEHIKPLRDELKQLKRLEDNCKEAKIEENDYTNFSYDDLEYELDLASDSVQKKLQFIEGQIMTRQKTNLTQAQMKEFDTVFKHFDRYGINALQGDVFTAALAALGLAYDEQEMEDIIAKASNETGVVTYSQFIDFLVDEMEDHNSPDQVLLAFRDVADGKPYITELDLRQSLVPSTEVEYLVCQMPELQENDTEVDDEDRDYYHQRVTQALNEANRTDFSFLPNIMTRAVWNIMRSASDKTLIDQAGKYFDNLLKTDPCNLFAMLGKARIFFSRKNYIGALKLYQTILLSKPDFNPDPRIGIGLCFWELNMKLDAKVAWERSLEL
ncbi:hypothetical protein PCK2_000278, partial [Pneumocystis canis]